MTGWSIARDANKAMLMAISLNMYQEMAILAPLELGLLCFLSGAVDLLLRASNSA